MKRAACIISMAASLIAGCAEKDVTGELVTLGSLNEVGGSSVGYPGLPGEFYKLSLEIERKGNRRVFESLTHHKNPIARTMGLVCLARAQGVRAVPVLMDHLGDWGHYTCFPGGCVGSEYTVGEVVRQLLQDRFFLGCEPWFLRGFLSSHEPYDPALLPKQELEELDIRILTTDRWAASHHAAAESLGWKIQEAFPDPSDSSQRPTTQPEAISWTWIRHQWPKLPQVQIIKAFGRIPGDRAVRRLTPFLIACLDDASLPTDARVAAASALTRHDEPEAASAIQRNSAWLDRAGGAGFAARSLDVREMRIRCRQGVADLVGRANEAQADPTSAPDIAAARQVAEEAFPSGHPALLDSMIECLSATRRVAWASDRVIECFAELPDRLNECTQPWNTYSDAGWRLLGLYLEGDLAELLPHDSPFADKLAKHLGVKGISRKGQADWGGSFSHGGSVFQTER